MVNRFRLNENECLREAVSGFYHADFGGVDHPSNPNFLYKFKNDPTITGPLRSLNGPKES